MILAATPHFGIPRRVSRQTRVFLGASKLMRMSIDVFLWTLGVMVSASVRSNGRPVREE